MNVLSLFDGISCGQLALQRAGIKVDKYFAAEIDKNAIKVTQSNFPNTIQLGSVTDVFAKDLPPIDLICAGSPCQGFSFAGKELNFEDPRSKLFFEFVRLIKECKPKYFLLENVVMQKKFEDVITDHVGVKPVFINSNLVSGQNRKRLYWTNIPFGLPEDKGIKFSDVCEDGFVSAQMVGRRLGPNGREDSNKSIPIRQLAELSATEKSYCLTTVSKDNIVVKKGTKHRTPIDEMNKSDWRYLRASEYEKLQTVPEGYTSVISESARRHALGNGWTVDIIAHIFKNLPKDE